jgi:hypothetical protein
VVLVVVNFTDPEQFVARECFGRGHLLNRHRVGERPGRTLVRQWNEKQKPGSNHDSALS